MDVNRDLLLNIVNTLPDSVLVLSRERGKIVEVNDLFLDHVGLTKEEMLSTSLVNLPFFTQSIKHGLMRLFVKAFRDHSCIHHFEFQYVDDDQTIKKALATAKHLPMEDGRYVLFTIRGVEQRKTEDTDTAESWKACMSLSFEPYMEFYPASPLLPYNEMNDRASFLKIAGSSLRVKKANQAATALYCGEDGNLTGKNFTSFFSNGEDALRFLDMLCIVGQMTVQTAVVTFGGDIVEVEMKCIVRFDDEGAVTAVYCSQRDLSGQRRYEAIIGGNRAETEFTFNQPFLGLAFLTPAYPMEPPREGASDTELDDMLEQILIMRANQTMLDIHKTDKAAFFMKPITEFFNERSLGRTVIKDLFVEHESSVEVRNAFDGELKYVSIFRGTFDDAGRLSGVMVLSSRQGTGQQMRHSSKEL